MAELVVAGRMISGMSGRMIERMSETRMSNGMSGTMSERMGGRTTVR
jgi:hypothetical protein